LSTGRNAVAIIGGGITGWLIGAFLARPNIECTVFDTVPCAAFSSTRNQGWLHSGVFYLARQDPVVAQACQMGSRWFTWFAPMSIQNSHPGYFLFNDQGKHSQFLADCAQYGLFAQDVHLPTLALNEPILQTPVLPFQYAAEVHDYPINTQQVLSLLANQACNDGVRFQGVGTVNDLQVSWQSDHWDIALSDGSVEAYDAVVLACGPYIPTLLNPLVPAPTLPPAYEVTKIPVLVIRGQITHSLFAAPDIYGVPHIVPFSDPQGSGVTVCLHGWDEPTQPVQDANDSALSQLYANQHADRLALWYGGLVTLANANGLDCHFYVCHKLRVSVAGVPLTRERLFHQFSPEVGAPESLVAMYPGKFTGAPVAANECVQHLLGLFGLSSTPGPKLLGLFGPSSTPGPTPMSPANSNSSAPSIAGQPRHAAVTPRFRLQATPSGGLEFV
jgi:glycine/D-amino acid oxidase-like deaminating enzyme